MYLDSNGYILYDECYPNMIIKVSWSLGVFFVAIFIFCVSVLKTVGIDYAFSQEAPTGTSTPKKTEDIKYNLAYPGGVLPDHILWPVKVLRDKAWVTASIDPLKKGEVFLLLADKRLASASLLLKRGKPDLAMSVMTKAEKYLEQALDEERVAKGKNKDTNKFLLELSMASLKHRQIMDEMLSQAPEDARPLIVKTQDYAIKTFQNSRDRLMESGIKPPENPFK